MKKLICLLLISLLNISAALALTIPLAVSTGNSLILNQPATINLRSSLDPTKLYTIECDIINTNPGQAQILLATNGIKFSSKTINNQIFNTPTFLADSNVVRRINVFRLNKTQIIQGVTFANVILTNQCTACLQPLEIQCFAITPPL